jgi:DNA-binding PadR family transcriptional regulator
VAAERPLAEWVCLALAAEGPTHGWAVARVLAPDGDVGRVWSLSRPLTYKALEHLQQAGLVTASGTEPGSGPARIVLTASPAGRRAVRAWLRRPIPHPRDVRTELLCKLVLSERAGVDTAPLIAAQRTSFAPAFDALARRARTRDADVVDRWRHASSQAVRQFLEREARRR